jgi:N-acetylglucosamine kinase-like BadF-type ATPase
MHLAVDAGNSKTAALVCHSDGRVAGTGRSGCGDIYGVARAADAVAAVLDAVSQAMAASGARPGMLKTSAFRLAGVDWPEDLAFWQHALARELPQLDHVSVRNDGFAPIRCCELSGIAVAIVVGTGHAIAGRGPGGTEWALSFWANDRLGAGGLGDEALRAACRHDLGLGEPTTLTSALLGAYGQHTIEGVLHLFTRRDGRHPWQDKGRVARHVLSAAQAGDPVARDIIDRHASQLAEYARAAAAKAGFSPARDTVPVILAGSVLTAGQSPLRDALVRELARQMPLSRPAVSALPPVAGAALDAIAEAGIPLTDETAAALRDSLPAGERLQTSAHGPPPAESQLFPELT